VIVIGLGRPASTAPDTWPPAGIVVRERAGGGSDLLGVHRGARPWPLCSTMRRCSAAATSWWPPTTTLPARTGSPEKIELLRRAARLAGSGRVAVKGTELTVDHVVVAAGFDPVMAPVPHLAEAAGVWTNGEATPSPRCPSACSPWAAVR